MAQSVTGSSKNKPVYLFQNPFFFFPILFQENLISDAILFNNRKFDFPFVFDRRAAAR